MTYIKDPSLFSFLTVPFKKKKLFIWLHQVLVLAHVILSCCIWDLVPWKWKSESHSVVSDSLQSHGLYSPQNSPGQNTGVGSHSLLQGIFPIQGSNPGLPHCWWILYQLSYKGSPRTLEWVAYPFSSRSSQPRHLTSVSCIAAGFFTNWAFREALRMVAHHPKAASLIK